MVCEETSGLRASFDALKAGSSEKAKQILMTAVHIIARRYAKRRTSDPDVQDEICQEVVLSICERVSGLIRRVDTADRLLGELRTWVRQKLTAALDRLQRKVLSYVEVDLDSLLAPEPVYNVAELGELRGKIAQLFRTLCEREATALAMHIEGADPSEVARGLNVSEREARRIIEKAIRKMQQPSRAQELEFFV